MSTPRSLKASIIKGARSVMQQLLTLELEGTAATQHHPQHHWPIELHIDKKWNEVCAEGEVPMCLETRRFLLGHEFTSAVKGIEQPMRWAELDKASRTSCSRDSRLERLDSFDSAQIQPSHGSRGIIWYEYLSKQQASTDSTQSRDGMVAPDLVWDDQIGQECDGLLPEVGPSLRSVL